MHGQMCFTFGVSASRVKFPDFSGKYQTFLSKSTIKYHCLGFYILDIDRDKDKSGRGRWDVMNQEL